MTLLDWVLAELITYSDSKVNDHNDKINAAYVNINGAVVSLYVKNKRICVGKNGSNKQDYCFLTKDVNIIVNKLRDTFV